MLYCIQKAMIWSQELGNQKIQIESDGGTDGELYQTGGKSNGIL